MKGSTKKNLKKLFFSVISIILCTSIIGTSSVLAYASVEYDAAQNDNVLRFNSLDDIANDKVCLIVFGNMEQHGADSEGRAIIGGNLDIVGGWSASCKMKFPNSYALVVGGDLNWSGWFNAGGCVAVPGNKTFSPNNGWDTQNQCRHGQNGANNYIHRDTTGWINAYVKNAEIAFTSASAQYASRPNDGAIKISGNTATLSPSADHVSGNPYVFNIDGNAIGAVNFSGTFGSDAIIINVSGKTPHCYGGNDGDEVLQNQAIWNYFEASTISISSNSVQGSLLAPYATFTGSNGHVNGTTIVRNMVGAGGFEYHTGHFFKDPLKATLTVTKQMSDGSTPDAEFGFTLYKQNGSSWTAIKNFTLKAGQSASFSDLPEGSTYKVVETDSGKGYGFVSVTGGATNNNSEKSSAFTVTSTGYKVVFTNEAKTGSITVSKKLVDSVNPGASFSFTLQKLNGSTWENVSGGAFTLQDGKQTTISNLEYGSYRIVEDADNTVYSTTVNGTETKVAEIALSADNSDASVAFTNTRRNAKLTVAKAIKSGDKDNGESFIFQLYKNQNNAWVKEGSEFSLKAGKTKVFDLPVGVSYKVEEIRSGSYTLVGVTPGNEVKLLSDYTMTFTNAAARMGITVTKTVNGEGNPNDEFEFTIQGRELNQKFTLKAGEPKTFDGLQEGDSYVITETGMGSIYKLSAIKGGTVNGNATTVTVAQGAAVEFVNEVKTGEIVVGKTLVDSVAPDATFTFTVKDENGNTVDTATIGNGETAKFTGLTYGKTYTVEETVDGSTYVTSYSIDKASAVAGSTAKVTISGSHNVAFTNERASTSIIIEKKLASGSPDLGESFTFQLYKKVNGTWTKEGDAFTLKAGKSETFPADMGAEYAAVETSTGASYDFSTASTASGGTSVTIDGKPGVSKAIAGSTTFTFVNKVKTGSIYVYKKLNDNIDTDASFTFVLQKYVNGAWTDVDFMAFGNEEGYQFSGLEYGYNYRVVEKTDSAIYGTVYNVYENASLSNGKLTVSGTADSASATTTKEIFLDSALKAVVFTNTRRTATLKVSKALTSGSANLGESFTFQIQRQSGTSWVNVGSPITLKAGDAPYSVTLEVGVDYRVVETSTGASYAFDSVAGADAVDGVNGGKINLTKDTEVTIYNKIKAGEITVTKKLVDTTNPDAQFSFTLYRKSGSSWISTGETFILGNGETKTISGLPYGGTYKVIETGSDLYLTVNSVSGVKSEGVETAEITVGKAAEEVVFTNTRKTATLTVAKQLKAGSYNFGDSFEFVLERQLADMSWKEVEKFTLKAGEKKDFTLAVGETYRAIETKTGNNYDFYNVSGDGSYLVAENGKGASVVLSGNAEIDIINQTKGASLTVRKSVVGASNATDSFTFVLQKLDGSKWVDVETFNLTAGASKDFNVQLGDSYRVYETKLGASYELTKISGGDTNDVTKAYAEVVIDGAEDITFVNTVKKGALTVKKTVVDGLNPEAKFAFTVQAKVDNEWKTIGNGLIGNDETFTIDNIEYGTVVRVVESVDSAKYTTINDNGDGAVAELTVSGNAEVNFTNTRKTASINVNKKLSDGSANVGGKFDFELLVKNGSTWTSVEKFQLGAGEKKNFSKLYAGAEYLVVESATGDKYVFDTVSGGTFTDEHKGLNGATVTASADKAANIDFYNANTSAKLKVEKKVVGDAGTDTFSFELQKKTGSTYTTVKTFTLAAGQSTTLDVVYGSTYRVVETNCGAIYKLTSVDGADTNNIANGYADITIVNGNESLVFTNSVKPATLIVEKKLADGSKNLGESFVFELFEKSGTSWKSVEEFELSAGAKKTFDGLVSGKDYIVVEKLAKDSDYSFVSISGADFTQYKGYNGGNVTLVPGAANNVVFTNMVKGASLTLNKSVVGDSKGDTFTFDIYKKSGSDYVIFQKGVVVTPGTPVTLTEGISIGDEFKIVETNLGSKYELTAIAGADSNKIADKAAFVKVTADGSNVTFTNTVRKASIKVTKKLAADNNNLGGTFNFELYKDNAGAWTYVEGFELKLGESTTFDNLVAGEKYLVIEKLANGSSYVFESVAGGKAETLDGYNGASVVADADKTASIVFTNKNDVASLTVKKVVSGTTNDNVFAFELQKKNGSKYETVETFNLTANETKEFTVSYGDEYRVIEKAVSSRYTLTSIAGADNFVLADKTADVKIDGAEAITFTNTVNTGSLTVQKVVAEDIASGKNFTFQLQKWNGTEFVNEGDAFQLANGEKKVFDGLEYGAVYKVVETENDSYTTKYKVGTDAETAGNEAAYTINSASQTIKFTNTRKQATLTIDKVITGADNGEEFTFQLQQQNGDSWKNVGEAFKLTAKAEPKSFQVDVDTKYRVIETSTGASYDFASADVDGASDEVVITDNGKKGVEFTLIGNADVTVTNSIKKTKLTLSKRVDGFANGDSFTFTVSKNGAAPETYTLKAGEFVEITADYEDFFVITEGTLTSRYELSGIVGADEVSGMTAKITIDSNNEAVEYTNKVKTGEVVITKTLADVAAPAAKFIFTAEQSTDGTNWLPLTDGSGSSSKSLGNGDQWKLSGIQFGTQVRITESVDGKLYTTTNTVSSGEQAIITVDEASEAIGFTNTRNTTKLSVYKELKAGDVNTGETFKFTIDGPNYDNYEFTLKVAEGDTKTNVVTFDKIVVGADYKVTETDSGKSYNLYSVEANGEPVKDGSAINIVDAMSIVYTNCIKSGKLVVKKDLKDSVDPNASFTVVATITDAEGKVTTQSGTISATSAATFTNIPFGSTVVVEEKVDSKIYTATYTVGDQNTNTVAINSDSAEMTITNVRNTAKLTVTKKIAEGDKDLGENFLFQLYELKNDKWTAKGDQFILANGQSKTFDLPVGVQYKVEELNSSTNYALTSVSPSNEVKLVSDANMTFTNSMARMGITVNKMVIGNGNPNDEFEFTIKGRELDETFTLKAGESKTFDNLQKGDSYVVTETKMNTIYELDSIVGGAVDGKSSTVVVSEGATVTFKNAVKKGSLDVQKVLFDNIDPTASFAVTATITDLQGNVSTQTGMVSGTKAASFKDIPYGSTVVVSETVDGNVYNTTYKVGEAETNTIVIGAEQSTMVITNTRKTANLSVTKTVEGLKDASEEFIITVTGIFADSALQQTKTFYFADQAAAATETSEARYAIGTSVPVEGVLYGATYTIEEKTGDVNYYNTTVNGVLGTTGKVTVTADASVVISNPRKTADLTIGKILEAGSQDLGETFSFQLYRLHNDTWEKVDGEFALKAGQTKTFAGMPVGFTYKVIETKTGANYIFGSAPKGTSLVNEEEGLGAMFLLEKDMTVDICNRLNPYSITVRKTVSAEGGDANAEFKFELQKQNGSKWETVEEFTLKANEDKLFKNLAKDDVYRVVEIDTGAAYDFGDVTIKNAGDDDKVDKANCSATVKVDGAEDIVFFNTPKKVTLTVVKKVTDKTDKTSKFNFELWKNTGKGWTFVEDFVLTPDTSKKYDVPYGVEYKAVESGSPACYELISIEGADSYDLTDALGDVTIDEDEEMIFTSTPSTGSLTVDKTVTGYDKSDAEFTFQLVDQEGYAVVCDGTDKTGKFTLKNGETANLKGIPNGTVLYVMEDVDTENYQTKYTINDSDYYSGSTTSTVVIGTGNTNIGYLNNYIGSVVLGAQSEVEVKTTTTPVQTPVTTTTVQPQSTVAGAADSNVPAVQTVQSSSPVISKVLGDYDTPTTGDGDLPMATVIAMAVSVIIVLSLGKKKKSGVGVK